MKTINDISIMQMIHDPCEDAIVIWNICILSTPTTTNGIIESCLHYKMTKEYLASEDVVANAMVLNFEILWFNLFSKRVGTLEHHGSFIYIYKDIKINIYIKDITWSTNLIGKDLKFGLPN